MLRRIFLLFFRKNVYSKDDAKAVVMRIQACKPSSLVIMNRLSVVSSHFVLQPSKVLKAYKAVSGMSVCVQLRDRELPWQFRAEGLGFKVYGQDL